MVPDPDRISWLDPDPDLHRDGENGSGTDPGSIKSSQKKGTKNKLFLFYFIRFTRYINIPRLFRPVRFVQVFNNYFRSI